MKLRAMHQTTMFRTTMAGGTSILGAVTAWLPQIETAMRIGASAIAIIAGIYAILNYAADLKHKRQNYEKNKSNTRTGSTHGRRLGLHDLEGD